MIYFQYQTLALNELADWGGVLLGPNLENSIEFALGNLDTRGEKDLKTET